MLGNSFLKFIDNELMLDAGYMSLEDLKARLLPGDQPNRTDWDEGLQALGKSVATQFDQQCNRLFERAVSAEKVTPANCSSICINRYPIETVTTVKVESENGSSDISAALRSLSKVSGILQFGYVLGDYTELVRVTYTGGYWINDGGVMPDGATELPADLLEAYVLQCQTYAEARGLFSTMSLRSNDSKAERSELNALSLHPAVEGILNNYRRYS